MNVEVGKVYRVKEDVIYPIGQSKNIVLKKNSTVCVLEISDNKVLVKNLVKFQKRNRFIVNTNNLIEIEAPTLGIVTANVFERNICSLLTVLSEQGKLTCDICLRLGIDDYCQSRDCVATVMEWAREAGE
jgi:hypothetical protein